MESLDTRVSDMEKWMKEISYAQLQTQLSIRTLSEEMKIFKDEMRAFRDDTKDSRDDLTKKWGELANKMGTIVEDIVGPNIPTIAKKYFGCGELDHLMIRTYKRTIDRKKGREFDIIAVCGSTVIWNTTKTTPSVVAVEQFVEEQKTGVLVEYFPEFKEKTIIPIFSSLSMREDIVTLLTKNEIYAMAMRGDTMELLNANEMQQRQ
jgi:hypothetical protein